MNKKKTIIMFCIIVVAIALVVAIAIYLLDNTGKINQGSFRINDAVITSTVKVDEKETGEEALELSSIVFNISQTDTLDLLVAKQSNIKSMYIDHIKVTDPIKKGHFYITQTNYDYKTGLAGEEVKVTIYPEEKEGQYYMQLNIVNDNCIKEVNVPTDTKLIRYDGTLLSQLNVKPTDLTYTVSFDLNIVDELGKRYVSTMKFDLSKEELLTNGISVTSEDVGKFPFVAK